MSEDTDLAFYPTKIQGGHNLGGVFGHIKPLIYTHNNIKVKSALIDCIADLHAVGWNGIN